MNHTCGYKNASVRARFEGVKKYSADQPRRPEGPGGGQFAPKGEGGGGASEEKKPEGEKSAHQWSNYAREHSSELPGWGVPKTTGTKGIGGTSKLSIRQAGKQNKPIPGFKKMTLEQQKQATAIWHAGKRSKLARNNLKGPMGGYD